MERLTKRDGILVHTVFPGDFGSANILERLAEYEDGGLEPYHITSILADNHKLIEKCNQLKSENAKLKELLRATIEVEPVKHGHWEEIKCNTILDKAVFSKALKCSECGKWKFGNVLLTQRFYYCPNCGAKMDSSEVR